MDGIDEAMAAGAELKVEVIASIEVSARHEGRNVHVLGPFIGHRSAPLLETLWSLRDDRERRARAIVELLNELGATISMDDVREQSGDGIVARPHIARAMVARGHGGSVADQRSQA